MTLVKGQGGKKFLNHSFLSDHGKHNVSHLIRELYKHDGDDDFVITGWDMYPTRFAYLIDDAYNYYNAHFFE